MPVVDLAFDSGTLHVLRAEVQAHAGQAGMPGDRAANAVLAVHELAANVVQHGAGEGRLRIWRLPGALRCQVDDGDPPAPADPGLEELIAGDATDAASPAAVSTLRHLPGHGLWVVRQVADQMQIVSGPHGTRAMITFDLP